MLFTRVMKLDENEIKKIIENGYIDFIALQSWSGPNQSDKEWFEVDDMYGEIEVFLTFEDNKNNFRKCTEEEIKGDFDDIDGEAFDAEELDEYRNLKAMRLYIDDVDYTRECIDEYGLKFLYDETGYIEWELKR